MTIDGQVPPVMDRMARQIDALLVESQQAKIERTEMHKDIKQLVAHVDKQNGRLATVENEIRVEQLILARAQATREAIAGMRKRDLAVGGFAVSALAFIGPLAALWLNSP